MKAVILALALSCAGAFAPVNKAAVRAPVELEAKKSVADLSEADLKGKKVLIRCDLNVPIKEGVIGDDTRIRASVPTVKYLLDKGAKVAMCSHLGRPKDGPEDKFSLGPVATRMGEQLGTAVKMAPDCIGDEVASIVDGMGDGEALLLENTRFYKEETKNDAAFVEKLAAPFDLFVNDAFGTAHRAHASTEGVTKYLSPSVSGYLLAKELEYLAGAVDEPVRPLAAIVGGGMTFTFLKAQGKAVGTSLVEDDFIQTAKDAMKLAEEKGCELIFPNEILVADAFDANANTQVVSSDAIPDGWMGLDNGPAATKMIQDKLADCKTVIWNGPMGVFEMDAFAKGTFAICDTLKELTEKGAITIIGGGDSVAAVEKAGLADAMSHISTGGGASLELLEGKVLPGVAALDEA